jgi:ParB family chromosome partitioning protein
LATKKSTEKNDAPASEQVVQIPLSELHPFEGHPFKVVDDELMQDTVDSIMQFGVLTPAIARPDPNGGYEMVAGHRRLRASEIAGKETMPVIVRNMTDDEAIILMVDSNLQRENILPSERAFAYRMKLEAIKHQGKQREQTSSQVGMKLQALDLVGSKPGDSRNQVHRYIRLTVLIPPLMEMVDQSSSHLIGSRAFYLKHEEQKQFWTLWITHRQRVVSQAQRLKKLSQDG